jgi:glutathione S-transferase
MSFFSQCVSQDDDGFELHESRAICRYLVAKYGPKGCALAPTELKAQALLEQAVSIESGYFESPAGVILREKVLSKYVTSCVRLSKPPLTHISVGISEGNLMRPDTRRQ